MTPERWEAIARIWQAVLACPPHERAAAIVELTPDDEALRRDVESLLEHLDRANAAGFGVAPLAVPVPAASLIGRRIGPYTVLALLGSGGMGEVYRAHDATLGRDVALKTLPGPWLADPERRLRFEREARLLASLNHPNIGAIYAVHESDGSTDSEPAVRVFVLELVHGETLAERIAREAAPDGTPRGLPIADVLTIARQLLEALQAAHERGIVHRDLKPANVKITPDGRVKVLDFGLGKAVSPAGQSVGHPPDLAPDTTGYGTDVSVTRVGLLLGTASYMSPEQARGQVADKRTDIWAFGCVLYEMLTGSRAFGGADFPGILANVIRGEVDWGSLPADTPSALRVCLRRCLQTDPAQRIHDAADVRLALDGAFEEQDSRPMIVRTRLTHAAVAYAGWIAAAIVAGTVLIGPTARDQSPAGVAQTAPPPVLLNPRAGGGQGSATAATIQAAIDLVAPGGTVRMLPGTYTETLKITKGLTLEAIGERTGPMIVAPSGTPESAIVIETTEPVTIRGLTVHVPGVYGVRGIGGVNLTIERTTVLAINPPTDVSRLLDISNDATATGLRARVLIRDSSFDGAVVSTARSEGGPQSIAVSLSGDIDGVVERNVIRRTGAVCVRVQTRDDFGGVTNVDILNNDIDECHPVAGVGAILVGSAPIGGLSPDRPVTASGTVNIVGNVIRNSSDDCLASAIAYDVFSGRIERNRIVDFIQPCAQWTSRNRVGAISIGLRVTGIEMPPVAPSVRFNDIHGNWRAGLHINDNQAIPVDASCNYWGSEDGPSGIGPGSGDAILVAPAAPPPVFLPFARTPIVGAPDGIRPLEQPAPRC